MPEFAWLTRAQAAERAQLSERTLARAIEHGELRAFRVGAGKKLWRIKPCDLDAWIEGGNTPSLHVPKNDEHERAARPVVLGNNRALEARPVDSNIRRAR